MKSCNPPTTRRAEGFGADELPSFTSQFRTRREEAAAPALATGPALARGAQAKTHIIAQIRIKPAREPLVCVCACSAAPRLDRARLLVRVLERG